MQLIAFRRWDCSKDFQLSLKVYLQLPPVRWTLSCPRASAIVSNAQFTNNRNATNSRNSSILVWKLEMNCQGSFWFFAIHKDIKSSYFLARKSTILMSGRFIQHGLKYFREKRKFRRIFRKNNAFIWWYENIRNRIYFKNTDLHCQTHGKLTLPYCLVESKWGQAWSRVSPRRRKRLRASTELGVTELAFFRFTVSLITVVSVGLVSDDIDSRVRLDFSKVSKDWTRACSPQAKYHWN